MQATVTDLASATLDASYSRTFLRHAATAARIVLGLVFFTFGLDGFLHFVPQPDPSTMPAGAMALGAAFMASGYMFPLIKGTEVLVGMLLLANRFVPLSLVLLAPVMVNIFLFTAFLSPSGLALPSVLVALHIALAWKHRSTYKPLLSARA
jgi:hypothetical protein